jgi:hypothetical protein
MSAVTMARPGRAMSSSAVRLLVAARAALAEAAVASDSGERYAAAHLAALRGAAVVLADRTRPADLGSGDRPVPGRCSPVSPPSWRSGRRTSRPVPRSGLPRRQGSVAR